ncbi:selenium metabolism-associated LysR family transcriptional regulator [Gemmiger sp. An194]|uniref:selenium metabolism-associated LysR family transcriptional regulator n=1 Tax=Gemmiger sp. An194 TaxID=1965582 RepID=UPI000B3778D1|nr:selenium metabolism-associated LysR family transcriptional regulator [Gemmiger sp. An194]OUP25612.1 LysR family transcriptional regulator [Gemmiger sp. An194]
MEIKQLRSFAAVVRYGSFTRAAENTYLSQPTISTHIRALEEELNTQLLLRDTKNLQVTPRGQELYECACRMLELQDNLLQRWRQSDQHIIQLGASTIPSAYILPEVLPLYGKQNPGSYFVVHQSDSRQVIEGVAGGLFDVGMSGMPCQDETIRCEPFFRDRMVLITPVSRRFLALQSQGEQALPELLREPIILRETGSGSQKSADRFLAQMGLRENELRVTARVNDQESIKNLVSGGLGVSIVSEKAVRDFVAEKRLLAFPLPSGSAERNLYLLLPRHASADSLRFCSFVREFYRAPQSLE